ncbi:MAG: RidA family protein [Planctomycetes bacterium]|nr:RidA family protein [Planctomycetota bacterium]
MRPATHTKKGSPRISKPSERLKELGLTLPEAPKPVAAYVPCVKHGDMLILSGQIPVKDGKIQFAGQVGLELRLEAAQDAARLCTMNALAVAADAAGGIDNIARILKVVVYVASHEDFTDQHKVANGASELLVSIFGDAGKHARAAVGVAELPLNSAVEIDITFAVSQ